MALVISDGGLTIVSLRYVEAKQDGSFQYRRRIPAAFQQHYGGKSFFVRSLKREIRKLAEIAADITARLDAEWMAPRLERVSDSYLKHPSRDACLVDPEKDSVDFDQCLKSEQAVFSVRCPVVGNSQIRLSDALAIYLKHHRKGSQKKFGADNVRVVEAVKAKVGDLPLEHFTRRHAEEFRDSLLAKNGTGTVRRRLNTLVAIFNKARKEKQLSIANPFQDLGNSNGGPRRKKTRALHDGRTRVVRRPVATSTTTYATS